MSNIYINISEEKKEDNNVDEQFASVNAFATEHQKMFFFLFSFSLLFLLLLFLSSLSSARRKWSLDSGRHNAVQCDFNWHCWGYFTTAAITITVAIVIVLVVVIFVVVVVNFVFSLFFFLCTLKKTATHDVTLASLGKWCHVTNYP